MKKKWIPIIIAVVIVAVIGTVGYNIYDMMFNGSVTVQMVDLIAAVKNCTVQLVVGGVILLAGLIAVIASRFLKERHKKLVTVQGCVSIVLAFAIAITWICAGPQYSNVTNVLSGTSAIATDHKQASVNTAEKIAEEGITLLKNEGNALPLQSGKKLNVFGWSSTNPVYGGSGSGSTSAENRTSLIQGLEEAGFETNKTIEEFYTAFRSERPVIGFTDEDFTVPERRLTNITKQGSLKTQKNFRIRPLW